jgi:hypothetical protein
MPPDAAVEPGAGTPAGGTTVAGTVPIQRPPGQVDPAAGATAAAQSVVPAPETAIGRAGGAVPVSVIRQRERARALRDAYGTDDPVRIEQIKQQRQQEATARAAQDEEYRRLKAEKEERERSTMTEQQKLQADLDRQKAENAAQAARIAELESEHAFLSQDMRLRPLIDEHVRPRMAKYAQIEFATHLKTLSDEQVEALTERQIRKWFAKFVEENPEFAKENGKAPEAKAGDGATGDTGKAPAVGTAGAGKAPPVVRRVLATTSRVKPGGPVENAGKGGGLEGKTPRPGQPNSMNKAELREYQKRMGVKPWS